MVRNVDQPGWSPSPWSDTGAIAQGHSAKQFGRLGRPNGQVSMPGIKVPTVVVLLLGLGLGVGDGKARSGERRPGRRSGSGCN